MGAEGEPSPSGTEGCVTGSGPPYLVGLPRAGGAGFVAPGAFDVPVARSTVEPVMVAVQRQVEAQPAALGIELFQQTRTMGAFQPAVDSAARCGDAEGERRRAVRSEEHPSELQSLM